MNDAKLYIRLPSELKDEFEKTAKEQDITQSQILRKCIREFIKQNKEVSKSQKEK